MVGNGKIEYKVRPMKQEKLQKLRMINAIKFFNEKVEGLSVMKLNKLLFLFDIYTFKNSGHVPTGLMYNVEKNGPAPKAFNRSLINGDSEYFAEELNFKVEDKADYKSKLTISVLKDFNDMYFSDFQLDLLQDVVEKHGNMSADELSDLTHEENSVYDLALKSNGLGSVIDFTPTLRGNKSITKEYVVEELGYNAEKAK